MENNDRILTNDDKLWLIETTLNSNTLDEVKSAIKGHFVQTKTNEDSQSKSPLETPQTEVKMKVSAQPQKTYPGQANYHAVKSVPEEASIYAADHREVAMIENGMRPRIPTNDVNNQNTTFISTVEQPKAKVLEQPKSSSKVVYENIRTLAPGEQL